MSDRFIICDSVSVMSVESFNLTKKQNLIKSSLIKIPFLERHLNDNPDDVEKLTELAQRYQAVGRLEEAQALQQYLSQPK